MTGPTEPGYYWCRRIDRSRREIVWVSGLIVYELGVAGSSPLYAFTDWSGPIKEEP